jgi:hypothetical protein
MKQNQTQNNASIAAAENRDKTNPNSVLTSTTQNNVAASTQASLANNPIIASSVDSINKVVTTTTQGLAAGLTRTITGALKPLQSASDAYFTTLALVSTASVEIAMELARGNASLIVSRIAQKETIITQLKTEATALYNAVSTILQSQPFLTPYVAQLLAAYNDIVTADQDLKSVVAALETSAPYYNDTLFNAALSLLTTAQALILPGSVSDTSQVRTGTPNTANNTPTGPKQAVATALVIPGISEQIAKLMVQYAVITEEINLLISLYLVALSSFISTYKRNPNVDLATINHINSATSQLDSLLASMKVYLFPTDAQKANPLFPVQLTSNATTWGLKLAAIIQWLKVNPGAASQSLNVTGQSVTLYNKSIANLNAQGNITYNTATLLVTAAQENVLNTGEQVARFLFDANTVLATRQNPRNVLAEMQQFLDLMSASHELDQNIISYLTPFINTPNELIAGAKSVVSNLSGAAKSLGFDRVGDLIAKGDISNLFATNAATATYVGAALVGVRGIISTVSSNPNATDQDMAKLNAVSTDLSSQNAVKQVDASRSATDTTATYAAQTSAQTAATNQDGNSAIQVAQKYTPSASSSTPSSVSLNSIFKNITGNSFGLLPTNPSSPASTKNTSSATAAITGGVGTPNTSTNLGTPSPAGVGGVG